MITQLHPLFHGIYVDLEDVPIQLPTLHDADDPIRESDTPDPRGARAWIAFLFGDEPWEVWHNRGRPMYGSPVAEHAAARTYAREGLRVPIDRDYPTPYGSQVPMAD